MTYCPQCGYALREGTVICPACGVKTAGEEIPVKEEIKEEIKEEKTVADVIRDVSAEPEKGEAFPIPEPLAEKEDAPVKTGYGDNNVPTGKYALLSTGGYLLNQLLFMVPGVGLLFAIIMACASKKVARRRHALSAVILHLLFVLLAAGIVGISSLFGTSAVVAAVTEWLRELLL